MGKNLLWILGGNIINLFLSLINGMILPYYLPMETFASLKTFTLFITFSGLFTLGYNDGMILKFGGKEIKDIRNIDLGNNFQNFLYLELFFAIIMLLLSILLKNMFLLMLLIGGLGTNIIGYYKAFYQATGNFKLYSKILNYDKIIILVYYLILIFIFKVNNVNYFIWGQVIVSIIIAVFIGIKLNKIINFLNIGKFQLLEYKDNIKTGFVILCANMSTTLYLAIDRFFVKILMGSKEFAIYAFVVNLETIVETFLVPIKIAMFNYFCKENNDITYKKVKKYTLLWGYIVISIAFPIKFIIENYLVNYKDSISIIFILFAMEPFYIITSGIYANIYKVKRQQKKYFNQMICMLFIAVFANFIFYNILKDITGIALGTLFTSILWFAICEHDINKIRFSIREYITSISTISTFILCGIFLKSYIGLCLYLFLNILFLIIFEKSSLFDIYSLLKQVYGKIKLKKSKINY